MKEVNQRVKECVQLANNSYELIMTSPCVQKMTHEERAYFISELLRKFTNELGASLWVDLLESE